jgi:hypothetical protein
VIVEDEMTDIPNSDVMKFICWIHAMPWTIRAIAWAVMKRNIDPPHVPHYLDEVKDFHADKMDEYDFLGNVESAVNAENHNIISWRDECMAELVSDFYAWMERDGWTDVMPTEPGYYWIYTREFMSSEPSVYFVELGFDHETRPYFTFPVSGYEYDIDISPARTTHWMGPISLPEPPEANP